MALPSPRLDCVDRLRVRCFNPPPRGRRRDRPHPTTAARTRSTLALAYTIVEVIARCPSAYFTTRTSPVRWYNPSAKVCRSECGE